MRLARGHRDRIGENRFKDVAHRLAGSELGLGVAPRSPRRHGVQGALEQEAILLREATVGPGARGSPLITAESSSVKTVRSAGLRAPLPYESVSTWLPAPAAF